MRRMLLMIWKEFLHIRNDELTIRLMVFPVLLQIFVLGYALVTEIRNTPITILDLCNTSESHSLIQTIVNVWFGIPFKGSLFVFLLFGVVYMMSSLGIGIFTSTIAKTPQQVLFLIWFILIFFILLSGFFIPVDNMPLWVQKVSGINPVRFFMAAIRAMFLKGSSLSDLWPQLSPLMVIGPTVFGASILFFQRRSK